MTCKYTTTSLEGTGMTREEMNAADPNFENHAFMAGDKYPDSWKSPAYTPATTPAKSVKGWWNTDKAGNTTANPDATTPATTPATPAATTPAIPAIGFLGNNGAGYDATQRDVSAGQDTVAGQITGILDDNSKYIQRARAQGTSYAASRGLLNTSIAAGATEAAAIDAALPIAQQDADTYFRQGLENQSATNTALSTNAQLLNQTNLERLSQAGQTHRQILGDDTKLTLQTAADVAELVRQEAADAATLARQEAADAAAMDRTEFSELQATGRQEIIKQTNIQTSEARIAADKLMHNTEIDQEDRTAFTNNFNEMSRQTDVEITKIAQDPDLSEVEKMKMITYLNTVYRNNIQLMAGLYEFPITYEEFNNPFVNDYNASDQWKKLTEMNIARDIQGQRPLTELPSWA